MKEMMAPPAAVLAPRTKLTVTVLPHLPQCSRINRLVE